MKNKKYLAVLSASAIATILVAPTTAMAANGDIYKDGKLIVAHDDYVLNMDKILDAIMGGENYKYEYNNKVYNVNAVADKTADKLGDDFNKALDKMAKEVKGIDVKEYVGKEKVENLKIEANASSDTKINIKLSVAVDEAKAENFKIEGLTINSATLSKDKKEVKLDVAGAKVNKKYTVKANGLKIKGKVMDEATCEFTMPKAESLFTPEVTVKDAEIKADGQSSTLVTFVLKDANGQVMKDADKVEVAFTTTFGRLAEKRVTVQNGVATVLLTSETLTSEKTADITATVVEAANKNLIGLKANRKLSLNPNPTSGKGDEAVGARMTEIQAAQADRVIAYFNKEVSVKDYVKEGTFELDAKKAEAKILTNVDNKGEEASAKTCKVKGILPVNGNNKALQLILDTEVTPDAKNSNVLVDNSNIKVEFKDLTGSLPVPSTQYCKLTDARRPAMLSVQREGLKTLKITFSESIKKADVVKLENWVIDGVDIGNDAYGVDAHPATAEVGQFITLGNNAGEDKTNVVTITLGKDAKGNQIYFKSGAHSIQGANIGDWADITDAGNNVMNTQTLDFEIPVDNNAPNAKVEVQSPEQYIVTFDKEINFSGAKTAQQVIKLEKYNKSTSKWEDETKQTLNVEQINVNGLVQYKVQTEKDWTANEVYNTKESKQNYYNDKYRLVIAKDSVVSAANGVKNAKIELPLEGAMITPDLTSPEISKIVAGLDENKKLNGTYIVTMSEPVKISSDGQLSKDGQPTLAQDQNVLPIATAQFIKKDGSKTVNGKVESNVDAYDKQLKVTPVNEKGEQLKLDAGEWTLVVRSISDDIGNTAASATKNFTVKAEEAAKEDKFAVVWSFADEDEDLDVNTDTEHKNKGIDNAKHDYVYVKFNKPVSVTGDSKNALKTSNYQLNGMPLPTGTQIKANIKGLDDADKVTDSITILLPDGYLNGKNTPHVITISSYLQSTTVGDTLTNGGAKTLTWTADNADVFKNEFAAEKQIYTLEAKIKALTEALSKDLKVDANVTKVDEALAAATTELNNAKTAMEVKVEVEGKQINTIDLTSGKAGLNARYDAANKVIEKAKSAKDARDAKKLDKAKEAIDTAVKEANKAMKDIKESADGTDIEKTAKWVTADVKTALTNAIKTAEKAKTTVKSEAEAKAAAGVLDTAVETYTKALKNGSKADAPVVDTTSIDTAVSKANKAMKDIKESADGTDIEKTAKWVTADVKTALTNAIKTAEKAKTTVKSEAEAKAAAGVLDTAVETYTKALKNGTKTA